MRKKVLIAIVVILIIMIAVVCVLYFKPNNTTVETGTNLINTMANIESLTDSHLETSNELDNTLVETNSIENENNKENSNSEDTETKNLNDTQKNSTTNKSNNNTKEETKDKTKDKTNNKSNTNKVENTDEQNSDTNKENDQPKEQEEQNKNEEQQEQQEEINTELANTHFTKYNAEKTAHAVNYLNNLIKSQSDYDEFGGYAIAVTSKPTSNWFSYSDYKLNGLALSGYIVKVYIEDEYRYNSRGTSYSLYDTKAYVYQEFMD